MTDPKNHIHWEGGKKEDRKEAKRKDCFNIIIQRL